jgi:SAM-dependent methyltransferase
LNITAPGFYGTYASYKGYQSPLIGAKLIRRLDAEIWRPAACDPSMSFLEIGCGTGAFLGYLRAKGVGRLLGIDHDPALAGVLPVTVRDAFACRDAFDLLADPRVGPYDRVVLLDVLEHFSAEDGARLLAAVRACLAPGGRVVLKVPNAASPWGLSYQYGDLTHCTAFTPLSIRQLADSAGFGAVALHAPQQGSRRRRFTDALVNRVLSWALLTPPEMWSANLYAVLSLPLPAEGGR